jgi:methyltransferase
MIAVAGLIVMLVVMVIELQISTRNQRYLQTMGAIAAPDPVFPVMRVAYPGVFVAMALEGSTHAAGTVLPILGASVLLLAKAFKAWAILALDGRWTFRVFVLPDAPLVTTGPYRWFRHPNYIAVTGELIGFALLVAAPLSGVAGLLFFGELLRRRIRSEEEALQIR